jgi:ABC-type multidrug transport system ATPase subunit
MFEAEELGHRIAVLSKGRVVARDTVAGLRRMVGGDRTLEVEAYGFEDHEIARLKALAGVSRVVTESFGPRQRLTVRVPTGELSLEEVRKALGERAELELRERRTTLEDVYLDLVEEEAA